MICPSVLTLVYQLTCQYIICDLLITLRTFTDLFGMSEKNLQPQKMSSSSNVSYAEESQTEKLARKARDAPFLVLGLAGLIGACGYGAYAYKNRGKMSTSVYLMQLRVGAQGAVVGCLTLGIVYNIVNEYILPSLSKKD